MTEGSSRVQSRVKRLLGVVTAAMLAVGAVGCGTGSGEGSAGSSEQGGPVTLEFAQWWAPELPEGSFQELMTQFESQNPNIKVKLLSAPYASTKQQLVSGAASKTLPDVVGLDGAWVNDFAKQGAITDLSTLMADSKYDESQLASQVKVDGKTYMIPVVNFVYPLFVNKDLSSKAGVKAVPTNRSEFLDAAKEDQRAGRQRQRLGLATRHRSTERHSKRRDVVAVGIWRQHAHPRRQAQPHQPSGEEHC